MYIKKSQIIVCREFAHHLGIAGKIKHITLMKHHARRRQLLVHRTHETVLTAASTYLQHVYAVFTVYIQFNHRLSDKARLRILHMYPEQSRRNTILADEFLERLA